jgi:hypothetical protein
MGTASTHAPSLSVTTAIATITPTNLIVHTNNPNDINHPSDILHQTMLPTYGDTSTPNLNVSSNTKQAPNQCACTCVSTRSYRLRSSAEMQAEQNEILTQLRAYGEQTSAERRKRTSAPDARPLSAAVGAVAVTVIVVLSCVVLLLDLGSCLKYVLR